MRMGAQANSKEFWSSASEEPYVTAATLGRDGRGEPQREQ